MGCGSALLLLPPWREEHSACLEGGQLAQSTMKGAGSASPKGRVTRRERERSVDFMVGEIWG